jgi:hypothetical protein
MGDNEPNSRLSFNIVEPDDVYQQRARRARRRERADSLTPLLVVVLVVLLGVAGFAFSFWFSWGPNF